MSRPVFVLVFVLSTGGVARAQGAGTVYAAGGVAVTHQDGPSGESSQTYVTAPGGTTTGWSIGGGVFVTGVVAVDVELASTGWMRSRQPSRYGMTFNEERRDRFVSIAARLSWPARGPVRIEPVAGMVLTFPDAWGRTERYLYWLTPQQTLEIEPREQRLLDTGIGLTAGADLRLGARHVAALPSFRVMHTGVSGGRYTDDSSPSDIASIYPGGYPEWTWRAGLSLRVDF